MCMNVRAISWRRVLRIQSQYEYCVTDMTQSYLLVEVILDDTHCPCHCSMELDKLYSVHVYSFE